MRSKNILITGGAGFIGSHLILLLVEKYPDTNFIILDALTYAGDLERLSAVQEKPNFRFIHGNICNQQLVEDIFQENQIDGVMHLAAESHVDNSISGPRPFVETNIIGTFNLLEASRKYWDVNQDPANRFLHVSTDEVYGSLGTDGYFTEESSYAPSSPYSSSKASSDMIARSYFYTYGLPVVISNCSNNYGPMQHSEKLIPTIIRKCLAGESIPIFGNGQNIRDWLYVGDHANALEAIFIHGKNGESYNVGTNNELSNLQMAERICAELDQIRPRTENYKKLITFIEDRAGHDFRYAIDATKLSNELGWSANGTFEEHLPLTVKWYADELTK